MPCGSEVESAFLSPAVKVLWADGMGRLKEGMLRVEKGDRCVFLGDALASNGERERSDGGLEGPPPEGNIVLDDQSSALGNVVPETLFVGLKGGVGVKGADADQDAAKAREIGGDDLFVGEDTEGEADLLEGFGDAIAGALDVGKGALGEAELERDKADGGGLEYGHGGDVRIVKLGFSP